MKFNRQGVTRIVLLTRRYAIKFPRIFKGWKWFIQGVYSNMSEAECWRAAQSPYLCPVLFSFAGLILIMPKIPICKIEDELRNVPREPGEDRKPINYGYYDERIVCVDYPYHRIKPYKR